MCVWGWGWSRASQLFSSGCAKKPEKSSAAGLLHNGTGRAEGTSSPPGLDQEHAGLMWTPRATSTTPTWQDTHKLAQGKDNRANQNPQKFVFTSMYTKSQEGYLPGNCQCGHACMCVHVHTQLMSVVHGTCVGTTKLTKVQPVTGSSFPMETEGGALGRKRQRPGGQRVGDHPRTPPPPSVRIRGWLNALASFLPFPPVVQHHPCSHRQRWEGQLQQSVSENADTVFYTRLVQASKCYINKAEKIPSLPSCAQ